MKQLTNLFNAGVNFGQAEVFLQKQTAKNWVLTVCLPQARLNAIQSNYFQNVDPIFQLLGNLPNINSQAILDVKKIFADQLLQDKSVLNAFAFGGMLGQIEAFGQIWQNEGILESEIDYLNDIALPSARVYAIDSGLFKDVGPLFSHLSPNLITKDNLERKALSIRLTFYQQLVEDKNIFRAGAAKIELKTWSDGHEPRPNTKFPLKGDAIFVRALVIDDNKTKVAIVSVDVCLLYDINTTRIKREVERLIGFNQILLVATHTHSSIEVSFNSIVNPDNSIDEVLKGHLEVREEQMITAIITAAGLLEPSEVGYGKGERDKGFNRVVKYPENGIIKTRFEGHNRNDLDTPEKILNYLNQHPDDPIDNQVLVVKFNKKGTNETVATIVNYAMHPVVYDPKSSYISADYVGVLSRNVENDFKGCCLFLQGAAGDIVPWTGLLQYDNLGKAICEKTGKDIADTVNEIVQNIFHYNQQCQISFATQNVPVLQFDESIDNPSRYGTVAEINTVSIGNSVAIATLPGEIFCQLGMDLKERSKSLFELTLVAGYTNHALGYIPTNDVSGTGGYGTEPEVCDVRKGTGESLIDAAIDMLKIQKEIYK